MSHDYAARARELKGDVRPPPDSKFCRWCQKRFANEAVYTFHLTGKKHIKALEVGGRKGEADMIRQKLADAKAREQSKKAQTDAASKTKGEEAKREAEEEAGQDDAKRAKAGAEEDVAAGASDGGAAALAAAKGEVTDVKVDLMDKQQMELAMAYASGKAKPMVNMAVNVNWWEGTSHATGATQAATLPEDVTAGNRNTQQERNFGDGVRPTEGAGSGNKDWKCGGNYAAMGGPKACDEWNYGNADRCRKCLTMRRMQ